MVRLILPSIRLAIFDFSFAEITHTAVQVLVARIEDNPFSEWTNLMTQVVRAAMDCQGMLPAIFVDIYI